MAGGGNGHTADRANAITRRHGRSILLYGVRRYVLRFRGSNGCWQRGERSSGALSKGLLHLLQYIGSSCSVSIDMLTLAGFLICLLYGNCASSGAGGSNRDISQIQAAESRHLLQMTQARVADTGSDHHYLLYAGAGTSQCKRSISDTRTDKQ